MRRNRLCLFVLVLALLGCSPVSKEQAGTSAEQSTPDASHEAAALAKTAFSEIQATLEQDNGQFWGLNLYGPILVVDPQTRETWANQADNAGLFTFTADSIYHGQLPEELNISNTAINWQGTRWTMVMTPLPNTPSRRKILLTHELFHRIQPEIGFNELNEESNAHLDEEQGRIYLRLELEALKKALNDSFDRLKHIHNALLFRHQRHQLYPNAKTAENSLEINEGLAEYTGLFASGTSGREIQSRFFSRINTFFDSPSYIRSFAYEMIPVYGFFMRQRDEQWHRSLHKETNLTDWLNDFFEYTPPSDLKAKVQTIASDYNYTKITDAERVRAFQKKQQIRTYKKLLVDGPTLVLPFKAANFSFDYTIIVPLEDYGTVYPSIRVTDNWGILSVEKAALMSPNWDKITIPAPIETNDSGAKGEGWTLELAAGWSINLQDGQAKLQQNESK